MRMATGRRRVRQNHGLRFAKLIGTGSGETFSVRDADPHHWGLISAWNDVSDARVFELSDLVTTWDRHSFEKARFVLDPIYSRGSWAGQEPFTPVTRTSNTQQARNTSQVAAITRARIPLRHWRRFASAVPPVAHATNHASGLLLRTGIGEAPLGLQGTFSVWENAAALRAFATGAEHQHVVDQTAHIGWYSEELFARFNVISATGMFCQQSVDLAELGAANDLDPNSGPGTSD